MNQDTKIPAILIERDYKGIYERFALTPKEFKTVFPEIFEDGAISEITSQDSYTTSPLVHIWYKPCVVGDDLWTKFFTDMSWELPQSDIESNNLSTARIDFMKSLLPYLPIKQKGEN